MSQSTGMARTAGRLGSLMCAAGVVAFFVGIFGGQRGYAFVGLALMVVSLVMFFIEEQANRRS
ncbi:MAG: hypothetical protein WBD16_01015 [Pyrinomonadaceae bacterium]